jgi:hypothetical protein
MPVSQDEATNSTGSPLYELLLPHAGLNVRVSRIGIGSMGAVEHYLGLLAATMGHLDGAVRHFEAAIRLNARMGAACYLANSRYQYARVLRARGPRVTTSWPTTTWAGRSPARPRLVSSFSCGVPTPQER